MNKCHSKSILKLDNSGYQYCEEDAIVQCAHCKEHLCHYHAIMWHFHPLNSQNNTSYKPADYYFP